MVSIYCLMPTDKVRGTGMDRIFANRITIVLIIGFWIKNMIYIKINVVGL